MRRIIFLFAIIITACDEQTKDSASVQENAGHSLFTSMPPETTHIYFANNVVDDPELNIFNYRNFYNGGGVAIGDVNNDGYPDIYLISNMDENKLYINKGNFEFENITQKAGVAGKRAWSTGATFADVNGDGFLDIYVCNSGNRADDDRANELYINNGDLTFTERAAEYGLDDRGFSTHAAFFDYDRDGDLDMYLLNNSFIPMSNLGYKNLRTTRDSLGGQKLFRRDEKKFTDVSEQAGIFGSIIGFGLGITVGDVNDDNWLDIYISNDFYERDYLYINNQNGTFAEASKEWMKHESLSSMGADIADIDNNGTLDIFVTDMLPEDDARLKSISNFESFDFFQLKLSRDFHYQYMENMLHLNNGDGTFSEIARLAGVHATDWSWGALLFDMDNDGLKDIFVANGIAKDLTHQDFVNFLADDDNKRQMLEGKKFNFKEFLPMMPSTPLSNYAFKNNGNLAFENKAAEWGLGQPAFSNGAAYGDLDNDGDLDLLVNNVNSPVSVFKNNAVQSGLHHFLRVKLIGTGMNPDAIGAKVYVYQSDKTLYLQQMPNRGFESSVDLTMIFGLGTNASIDSLQVVWPDDRTQVVKDLKSDTEIKLKHGEAIVERQPLKKPQERLFRDVTREAGLNYTHTESKFLDHNRDLLLKQEYSTQGPALACGDINGDGLDDVFLGGATGTAKKLFVQLRDGTFQDMTPRAFSSDEKYEDTDAIFFDADQDHDLDLFVVTGSNEFTNGAQELVDRLYLNDGSGNFTLSQQLPDIAENGSCVTAGDIDHDGDLDLFIGGRMIPANYGYDPPSYLYINDGAGTFKNYTKRFLSTNEIGMVTDALWSDLDGDKFPELIVVGDWMPVTIFKNNEGKGLIKTEKSEIPVSSGWWNTIKDSDIDGDGDMDFILGNLGRNSKLTATEGQPAFLYINDFDHNGTVEQIITCYGKDRKAYPMVLKHDLQKQIPSVKKKFVKYADYAGKPISDFFSPEDINNATQKKVDNANTSLLINNGGLKFTLQPLPVEAQFSPIFAVEASDFDQDGKVDVLLTGNFFDVIPEVVRYDANYGLMLKGKGNGNFEVIKSKASGFFSQGQVRKMAHVKSAGGTELIILAKNNDPLQVFSIHKK